MSCTNIQGTVYIMSLETHHKLLQTSEAVEDTLKHINDTKKKTADDDDGNEDSAESSDDTVLHSIKTLDKKKEWQLDTMTF